MRCTLSTKIILDYELHLAGAPSLSGIYQTMFQGFVTPNIANVPEGARFNRRGIEKCHQHSVIPEPLRRSRDHWMKEQRNIASLAVPWATIVALACFSLYFVDDSTFQSTRERILADSHNYKQIISEDHDPLFPLSKSDIYGFTFAILGLMVSCVGSSS